MTRLCHFIVYSVISLSCMLCTIQCQILDDDVFSHICMNQATCKSCINTAPNCKWCSSDIYNNTWRCNVLDRLKFNGCPDEFIIDHNKPFLTIIQDDELTDITETHVNPVQIRPQEYTIGLTPFDTQSITFQYRSAKNYPLDLYYLMDLTWTMKDDKETLAGLGNDLLLVLKNLTTDFKIGFGSYAEKPLMPYTRMDAKYRANPCEAEENEFCEPTTTYKHRLKITDDIVNFSNVVNNSKITGNLDNAEAGIEALMQVLVCDDKIGWRSTSRKIVVFATDSILHFAGDGILGGAPTPNDKKCRLDDDGNFIDDFHMDYPSLEELYRVLVKQKTSVIFAVTEDVIPYYETMKKLLPENIFVAALTNDSSNILNLVKLGYESIISVINFEDDSDDLLNMQYFTNCGRKINRAYESNRCEHIEVGETYTFTINITMNRCPANSVDIERNITVSEMQLGMDSFVINAKLLCDCDCNESQLIAINLNETANHCPLNSKKVCGICECLDGWSGKNCDCDKTKVSALKASENCKVEKGAQPCSGLGDCLCDSCQCDPGFDGKFCQCKACPISIENGQVCGGISRGVCDCGTCVCQKGWFGSTCSCSRKHCIAPWDNQTVECSGRGTCDCEHCRCNKVDGRQYTGKYCESCWNCTNPACAVYEECVGCMIEPDTCTDTSCISEHGTLYKKCDDDKNKCTGMDHTYCEYIGKCKYTFTYSIQRDWTVNLRLHEPTCLSKAGFVDKLAGGVIVVFILAIGLILALIWKCCDLLSSKKEYAKFMRELKEKEVAMNASGLNPIYKSPLSQFRVPPEYNKKIKDENFEAK